ncbi:hypothetical protein HNR19_000613 [Nocardioides thalensis]|uniref:DUF4349 domain-containing protein n=1 Tax=Nocardioides thalensis TaxID=1914755 RepID=A0A853BXQ9_9ACTN|nr:DUF4349 domain-containing protein [Nocardioides thalensis]NYI99914.1 hypothetical protein [Nocardioides thalensis]
MTSPSSLPRFLSSRRTAAAASAAALFALAACSGAGGSGGDESSADAGGSLAGDVPMSEQDGDLSAARNGLVAEDAAGAPKEAPDVEKAIISTGNVALESKDVEKAAFDVQQVVDEHGGEITDHKTSTDDEGEVRHARMVIRVPAEKFHAAFADLEQAADLTSSSSTSEDVTTQVIDNQVRIRAQRRSIQRIEVLLDRAQSIRDIMSIETQLTRRQADLDSLEQRQAYLQDQTSMSTITVSIERTAEEPRTEKEEDESGFVAGLSDGWDGLKAFGTWTGERAGNLLPFAGIGLLIGVPTWLLVRGAVRRRPKAPAATS